MATTYYLKENDTLPKMEATLTDSNGDALSLLAVDTVTLILSLDSDTFTDSMTVTDAAAGTVEWQPAGADWATLSEGTWKGEIELLYATGDILTVPTNGYLSVVISNDLDNSPYGNQEMKDAGLVAADAPAQVDSADQILDLGTDYCSGILTVVISAIEIASNDERYDICFQLSDSATFASNVFNRAILATGALEALIGGDTDTAVGTYTLPVDNEFGGTTYRYARVYTNVSGTVSTGINYTASLVIS